MLTRPATSMSLRAGPDRRHGRGPIGGLSRRRERCGGVAFEAPSRATDGNYDERVVAVGCDACWADQLQRDLGCVNHAHANAATMAEITRQAMADYRSSWT